MPRPTTEVIVISPKDKDSSRQTQQRLANSLLDYLTLIVIGVILLFAMLRAFVRNSLKGKKGGS